LLSLSNLLKDVKVGISCLDLVISPFKSMANFTEQYPKSMFAVFYLIFFQSISSSSLLISEEAQFTACNKN